ncbi:MAG TPA: hypothetical protein VNB24_03630 [Acidimicrobiales bacterium]|nr:hypothetical protein [Acidimicrobiales bacterium]
MRVLRGKAAIPVVGVSVALLVSAVGYGLRVPGVGFLRPFPDLGRLDYSAGPLGGFAPLDARLVAKLLGTSDDGKTSAQTLRQGLLSSRDSDAGGTRPARLAPVVVTHAFTNDHFANAYPIPSVPFSGETNTRTATGESGEPASCSAIRGKTAWYSYTATTDVGLLADTFGSDSATALSVYTGPSLRNLQREGECSSDPRGNALVAFAAKARTTYYFQLDGPLGGRTRFTLQEQGVTTRASVATNGEEGDGESFLGILSYSGRQALMASGASTFDAHRPSRTCAPRVRTGMGAPCGKIGSYARDRVLHRTTNQFPEQSVAVAGTDIGSLVFPGGISIDERFAVFWASVEVHAPGEDRLSPSSPYRFEVFRRNNENGDVEQVSVPCRGCGQDTTASSGRAEVSDDGHLVAFVSWADNLVPGDTNGARDVFVRDMTRGVTTRVSVASDSDQSALGEPSGDPSSSGDEGADLFSISGDGRYVVFKSSSWNLVRNDTNRAADVFVRDRVAGTTTRVNVSSEGRQANGETKSVLGLGLHTISSDGRYVFFNSTATNLVTPSTAPDVENVYRRDLWRGVTTLVTVSSTGEPANDDVISDPKRLAFTYGAPILISGGVNVTISELSYSSTRDGRFVVFNSDGTNLVPGDNNRFTDVFVHDIDTGTTTRVSVHTSGSEAAGGPSGSPTISGDGRFVAFDSAANNLVDGDTNDSNDVFVREIPGGQPLTGWH